MVSKGIETKVLVTNVRYLALRLVFLCFQRLGRTEWYAAVKPSPIFLSLVSTLVGEYLSIVTCWFT